MGAYKTHASFSPRSRECVGKGENNIMENTINWAVNPKTVWSEEEVAEMRGYEYVREEGSSGMEI